MSAFIVESKTINSVVSFIQAKLSEWPDDDNFLMMIGLGPTWSTENNRDPWRELAERMYELNCSAVNQRYKEGTAEEMNPGGFEYHMEPIPEPGAALKNLGCWLYQCCEGDVEKRPLYRVMDGFRDQLAHDVATEDAAYAAAPWR